MAGCVTLNKAEHIESMRKIEETWNKDKTLVEQFGEYKEGNQIARTQLRQLVWERTEKYYDEDILLTKQQAEDQNALALADEEIQLVKEAAAEWEHKSKSVRKIPFLGTDTLSYQSDFILRFKDHTKEWNDLVSDFQNKYLPTLKEGIDSFVTRVKNVEI